MTENIKIFISHRIDKEAQIIDNPFYIPVRCGACFDKKNSTINGDNIGDNISERRMSFCELTVLYWAWKNQTADYMGLCHYRRYLSFKSADKSLLKKSEHDAGCLSVDYIDKQAINTFGLDQQTMASEISQYDAIFMEPINLEEYNLKSNYEAMRQAPDYHFIKDVDYMMEVIKKKYPQMYQTAYEYMHHTQKSFLYNCFIMKYDLFNNYCNWLFDILFELEKHIDMQLYSTHQYRTLGTLSERLLGIYILWLEKQNIYKIKYNPLLFIKYPEPIVSLQPAFQKNNIAIASNFNDKYAPIFSVFLQSVIEHSSLENNYDFIILSNDITDEHKHCLENMLKPNMRIRFVSPKYYLKGIKKVIYHSVYCEDLYYRIVIPHILKDYDKILVVDADMICLEDIATVYNEDIGNFLAGAVKDTVYMGYLNGMDPGRLEYSTTYMKMDNPYCYVNTGLLLFNATKFREYYSLEFLQDFIAKHMGKVKIYEQDMLNMLLNAKLKFLDNKWNCYTKSNEFVAKCLDKAPYVEVEKWNVARNSNGGIIHYAAHPKPWQTVVSDCSLIFWKYARNSLMYEEILQNTIHQNVTRQPDFSPKLLYVITNINHFRLKKMVYKLKKIFSTGKKRTKYQDKYKALKRLLKEAKKFKKQMIKI